jgi:hypothetical protein
VIVESREIRVVEIFEREFSTFRAGLRMDEGAGTVFALEVLKGRFGVWIGRVRDRMFARARNASGEALDLTDRHATAGDFFREVEALRLIGDGEKCPGVASSDFAFLDELLDRDFEFEKADGIGDCGAVFAGALGDLLLGEVKFVGEALEGVCLLDRIEVFALEIFDEGHLHRHTFGYVADDDGYAVQLCALCGAPATFASDELIAGGVAADNERLDDPTRANRLGELLQCLFAEARAGLVGARLDQVNIDVKEELIRNRRQSRRRGRCLARGVAEWARAVEVRGRGRVLLQRERRRLGLLV